VNLPQIRINITEARLGLNISKPLQRIDQEPATMQIQQPKAEMRINRRDAKLTIDQTRAWEDMDLKHIFRRIEEFAQNGVRGVQSGIARLSQEGDQLMKIENGGKPLISQAVQNSQSTQFEFNVGFVPSPFSVKINYQRGNLDINWNTHKPRIDVQTHKPIHDYTPGKVSGYMLQKPSLEIDFVGGSVNQIL
jgi:hypothetical protein